MKRKMLIAVVIYSLILFPVGITESTPQQPVFAQKGDLWSTVFETNSIHRTFYLVFRYDRSN